MIVWRSRMDNNYFIIFPVRFVQLLIIKPQSFPPPPLIRMVYSPLSYNHAMLLQPPSIASNNRQFLLPYGYTLCETLGVGGYSKVKLGRTRDDRKVRVAVMWSP